EREACASMVLKETADAERWGAIEVDDSDRVTRIIGQGTRGERACMFTGVHLLSPRLVDRLPTSGESDSIRQGYLPALADGELILGHRLTGFFHEHSTPTRYLEGNLHALYGRAGLRHLPGPLTGVAGSARVDATATLIPPYKISDDAQIGPECIIG